MTRALAPADRARLAARLDMISDQLAELTAELAPAGGWPAKHCDRARRAAESATRALDRQASNTRSTSTGDPAPSL